MKTYSFINRLAIVFFSFLMAVPVLQAQEKNNKFGHILFPDEIKYLDFNSHAGYAGNTRNIWKFNTKDFSFEPFVDIKDKGLFTEIQGLAGRGENLYYYVSGEGVYKTSSGVDPKIVKARDDDFVKHYEEAYSGMRFDPTGRYLILNGWKENAVVFDIENGMKPVVVFNDYVRDAYWLDHILWAGCLDKVVANKRAGKSMNNEDFIYYETNDQHGLIKFPVSSTGKLPNFGEDVIPIAGKGEIIRLIYNKANNDLLLCLSTNDSAEIYKMSESGATLVAELKGSDKFSDFAAYGNKIVATSGRGFVEATYPYTGIQEVTPQPIKTNLPKPKLWPGAKPDPFEINYAYFMDFDESGNLWIGYNRDLFVVYK